MITKADIEKAKDDVLLDRGFNIKDIYNLGSLEIAEVMDEHCDETDLRDCACCRECILRKLDAMIEESEGK